PMMAMTISSSISVKPRSPSGRSRFPFPAPTTTSVVCSNQGVDWARIARWRGLVRPPSSQGVLLAQHGTGRDLQDSRGAAHGGRSVALSQDAAVVAPEGARTGLVRYRRVRTVAVQVPVGRGIGTAGLGAFGVEGPGVSLLRS